jgi:urease accessory protein
MRNPVLLKAATTPHRTPMESFTARSMAVTAMSGIIALLNCGPAAAHAGTGLAGGFVSGASHPFRGVDHLLAMVAVGLWGAFLGRPLLYGLPVMFPLMMVCGAALGMFGVSWPAVDAGVGLSVLVLGSCIAVRWKAPVWAACLLAGIFALFHGYAHGRELPSAADPIGFSLGFVFATGLLHATGIGIGLTKDLPGGVAVARGVGGVIGGTGIWFLTKAIGS